ncbi:MAG: SH3 domain-containing protein [Anaerolineaceae bacterium]|nr:SH3 domain-containing protein [Anaerolineaceae bacterium]
MRIYFTVPLICLLLILVPVVAAQNDAASCVAFIDQALADLAQNCTGLGGETACYGAGTVTASGSADFSQPGDRTGLSGLESLQTAALDAASGQWGLAVMNVQANVPASVDGPAVTYFLVGDVTVENAVAPESAMHPGTPITVTTLVGSNIRLSASTDGTVLASAPPGTEMLADARTADSAWLRVLYEGRAAWVSTSLLALNDPVDSLPVVTRSSRTLMQNFFLRTGSGLADCEGAVPALLVLQAPENISVLVTVNGQEITLTGTTALWITEANELRVMVLSGGAQIGNLNLPAGFTVKAPLSADGRSVAGAWENLRSMLAGERTALTALVHVSPDVLGSAIQIPSEADIQQMLAALASGSVGQATTGPASGLANCSRFAPTSPLGGMRLGTETFFWDGALGATNYRLTVYNGAGSPVGTFETGSDNTALSLDTAGFGDGADFSWDVTALVNNQVACTTSRVSVLRDATSQLVGGGGNTAPPDNPGSGGGQWGN